jgi:hypothetical protein
MVDLIALASVDMETEMTYIRRERDWADRATAAGRAVAPTRLLPMLPPSVAAAIASGGGHDGNGNGHGHGAATPALTGGHGATGDHAGHGHG